MPTLVPYPNCCGGNIIQGFSGTEDACLASFIQCVQQSRPGSIVKFVLNEGQCRTYPRVLAEAARVGFVVSAVWNNQLHDSTCIEFQRVGQRLRVDDTIERLNLPNQALAGNMGGIDRLDPNANLPAIEFPHIRAGAAHFARVGDFLRITNNREQGADFPVGSICRVNQVLAAAGANQYAYCEAINHNGRRQFVYLYERGTERVEGGNAVWCPGALTAGTRIRVDSPQSRHNGQDFTIDRIIDGGWDRSNTAIMRENDAVRISVTRLTRLDAAEAPQEWRVVPFRNAAREGDLPAAPAPVVIYQAPVGNVEPREPEVVYTAFHALFADGSIGGGYESPDRVREVNPRVRRYRVVNVFSDGTVVNDDFDF